MVPKTSSGAGVTSRWQVKDESGFVINFDDDKIFIAEYTHVDLNVYNYSYAIYEIETISCFIFFKTTNKYSVGVCNIYDDTYFIPKTTLYN